MLYKASLDTIRGAAADLIVKIDEKVAELTQSKDKNQFVEIDQWIAAHEDEFPFDNPEVNQPAGFIEITPPVDMNSLKAESKKPSKRKSVKKQIAEKKDKVPRTKKPKEVDTKKLGEAI